ncbi:hypothetical protein MTR67_002223 [Solanum verrucosum]|uniref:YTH domain-containing family protein n=1 Tax=Solanum verrucosum TaxID=315347 RepID=A0AAF0PQ13_SOLVR|nr:hypothetical protein MTR67_002223 [Solanum verrucosum]
MEILMDSRFGFDGVRSPIPWLDGSMFTDGYDSCNMGRGWMAVDNIFKPRGRGNSFYGYGNENMDGLNELNKNQESYSEDDVHKSIKYNVWASTPNGNKKLDVAYQKAQQKSGGKHKRTFVGVAEMAGSVDFNKNVEYWKQDKWIGCFHVKMEANRCLRYMLASSESFMILSSMRTVRREYRKQRPRSNYFRSSRNRCPKLVDDVKGAKPVILSDKKLVVANGIANRVANAC